MAGNLWRAVTSGLSRRPAALPLLALAVAIMAIASGRRADDGAWTGLPRGDWPLVVLLVFLSALSLLGLVALVVIRPRAKQESSPRRTLWQVGLIILLLYLLSLADFDREPGVDEESPAPPESTERAPSIAEPRPGFGAADAVLLLAVVGGALAVVWWARRGQEPPLDDEAEGDEAELGRAIDRAADHLLNRDDPRSAVLLAYRDLEVALDQLGHHRRPAETPTEHLDRVVGYLGIADRGPLLDLAGLYQRARFSHHEIGRDEQRRAGTALARSRATLTGTGP